MLTFIKGGAVWNGCGFEKRDIVLQDSVIHKLCPPGLLTSGEYDRTILVPESWILPGFINSHCHLALNSTETAMRDIVSQSEASSLLEAARNARRTLDCGFTTIRDCGFPGMGIVDLKREIHAGRMIGSQVVTCVRAIKITGGHSFGEEADGEVQVLQLTRKYIQAGADFIKLMATGGLIDNPEQLGLNSAEMKAAAEEAVRQGLPSAAHAHNRQGILNALAAGVSTIEHGTSLDSEIIDKMLALDAILVPTFSPYVRIASEGTHAKMPRHIVDGAKRILEEKNKTFEQAYRQGVRIAFGTDGGSPLVGHDDILTELHAMEEAGMSRRNVIRAATAISAEALGIASRFGSIEEGKVADLLFLGLNPLQTSDALKNRVKVMKSGVFTC